MRHVSCTLLILKATQTLQLIAAASGNYFSGLACPAFNIIS
jgi:hypothetical protein